MDGLTKDRNQGGLFRIKQQSYFRHALKISTDRLAEGKWDINVDLDESEVNGEMIALAESACIRIIEDICGVDSRRNNEELKEIAREIQKLRNKGKKKGITTKIKDLYKRRREIQYTPEYVCVVCKTKAAFKRACRGFKINGLEYERFIGTTGGIKNSVVVFVSKNTRNGTPLIDELRRRVNNGRDLTKEFIPSKLEAYMSLVCSASTPLSSPRGVLVVDDCITRFKSSYIHLSDSDGSAPLMEYVDNGDVELNESDGYGLMSPDLAGRWQRDLSLDYLPSGVCIRNSFCKGMVFPFDFHEFADDIAGFYEVEDAWGEKHDIRQIDLILTTSMLKLWDSYSSIGDYLQNCEKNGHGFAATKTTPKELDVERRLNYQFIQSYELTDEQIWELIEPTLTELSEAMGESYEKTLLFLCGTELSQDNVWSIDTPWVMALMADPTLMDDPYIKQRIKLLIKKRIQESKIGKVKVHGNFSVLSGDPYALCQSIFGLQVKGILEAGEIYNRYWVDKGANDVVCFRAPMSSHHNIKKLRVTKKWNAAYWYQYMNTVTVLNAWDTTCHALNGADKDGDLVFITDNPVLLSNTKDLPVIICEQKNGVKCIPCEKELAASNALGFGDDIGSITNRITAQTELRSCFARGSPEYEELTYRIICGQHLQQNAIDRAKGIVSKPMPREWYNEKAAKESDSPMDAEIVVDKKPYFMIHRYPDLRSRYNAFIKLAGRKCIMQFGLSFDELSELNELSDEQSNFLEWYYKMCPIQHSSGTINRLCFLCEDYFSRIKTAVNPNIKFDPSVYKCGVEYSRWSKESIERLYAEYNATLQDIKIEYSENDEEPRILAKEHFIRLCAEVCPDKYELCDILVDLCYSREKTKQFAWDIVGDLMAKNAIKYFGNKISYPIKAKRGDIVYGGNRYKLVELDVTEELEY